MTVSMMKDQMLSHVNQNVLDKQRLDTFKSQGKKPSELEYTSVQKTIWLNKNPKDWCPSEYQIHNMYGRCVLTCILFSIPSYFPPKIDLVKFGYVLENEVISFNLIPSLGKEKNVRVLLSTICKKMSSSEQNENGKRTQQSKKTKNRTKKTKPNSPEKLID